MNFGLEISGDQRVVLRFAQFPAAAHDTLLVALTDIERRLEAAVIAAEPARTGTLRNMTGGRVYDHDARIAAVVGVRTEDVSEARKAAALEYGSRGTAVQVRAHQATLDHLWSRAIAAIQVNVPEYSRTPHLVAERFLRGPIAAMREEAIVMMEAAVAQAAAETEA